MPSVIVTKIDADLRKKRDNIARSDGLADYCIAPENSAGEEKCVAFRALGFSVDDPDIETIKDEFRFDMDTSFKKDTELVSHWVISFKGEPEPRPEAIFDACDQLLLDLGYTCHHKRYFAIHKDTDNIHAHIVACKSDPFSGKILNEGWWKNESQKSIARSAYQHHWQLEPGAPFVVPPNPKMEKVVAQTPQGEREVTRPVVVKRGRDKDAPSIRCYAAKAEKRTGLKSGQRILQEVLRDFVAEHEEDFPKWKCGDYHRELARLGITCERVQHGNIYGLTYSIDGENFESATAACPALSYKSILGKLSAKSWRDAREEHKEIAKSVRAEFQLQQLMPQEQQKIVYGKHVIEQMRTIPTAQVWAAFGVVPKEKNRSGRKIANSFDICMSQGLSFSAATDFLAAHFSEYLKDQDMSIDPDAMLDGVRAEGVEINPQNLDKARDIARTMGAIRADKLDLTTQSRRENHRLAGFYKDQSLADICKKLDLLSSPGVEIWGAPVMSKGKTAIIISAVKADLYGNFPEPNLRLSSQTGEQAIYILDQKSKCDAFYDLLNERLNRRFGDPAQAPLIQIPGLSQKVKIVSASGQTCAPLAQYARSVYDQWRKGEEELPILAHPNLYNSGEISAVPEDLKKLGLREYDRRFEHNRTQLEGRIAGYEKKIQKFAKTIDSIERSIKRPTPEQLTVLKKEQALFAEMRRIHQKPRDNATELELLIEAILQIIEALFGLSKYVPIKQEQALADEQAQDIYRVRLDEKQPLLSRFDGYIQQGKEILARARAKLADPQLTRGQACYFDTKVARCLYAKGATPDQVYSFLHENSAQKGLLDETKFISCCKKTAINAAPASALGEGSKWQKAQKPNRKRNIQPTPGIDTEQDRKRPGMGQRPGQTQREDMSHAQS